MLTNAAPNRHRLEVEGAHCIPDAGGFSQHETMKQMGSFGKDLA